MDDSEQEFLGKTKIQEKLPVKSTKEEDKNGCEQYIHVVRKPRILKRHFETPKVGYFAVLLAPRPNLWSCPMATLASL